MVRLEHEAGPIPTLFALGMFIGTIAFLYMLFF